MTTELVVFPALLCPSTSQRAPMISLIPVFFTSCFLYILFSLHPVFFTSCFLYILFSLHPVFFTSCFLYILYCVCHGSLAGNSVHHKGSCVDILQVGCLCALVVFGRLGSTCRSFHLTSGGPFFDDRGRSPGPCPLPLSHTRTSTHRGRTCRNPTYPHHCPWPPPYLSPSASSPAASNSGYCTPS